MHIFLHHSTDFKRLRLENRITVHGKVCINKKSNSLYIYISGDVQRAGYRTKVVSIAKAFNTIRNVQNLQDDRVKITAGGEVENLKHFIQAIEIKMLYLVIFC